MPMRSKPRAKTVAAVLLAAGASTRLGQPKQLLRLPEFDGATMLDHVAGLAKAAGTAPVFVVLGAHRKEIELECDLLDCIVVRNEAWNEGMASSLWAGISAVMEHAPNAAGAMMAVCDQPALSAKHLRKLLAAYRRDVRGIVASRYAGRGGVPAIFPRATFPALLELRGDQGARAILQNSEAAIELVEFPHGELDIDSPEDLRRLEIIPRGQSHVSKSRPGAPGDIAYLKMPN